MPAGRTITEEECGLLRGVLASPEDVTARLVYADWLDERDDPRGPWLRAVCAGRDADDLRSGVDPDWAALFDRTSHFTVLLTAEIVSHVRKSVAAAQPLEELHSWATAQSDFRAGGVKPGDHVYLLQVSANQVHVLTRLRVAAVRSRTWRFTETEPLPRLVRERVWLLMPSDIRILDVADGGVLDYDRALPQTVLERLRFETRRGERGLTFKKDGKLTSITGLHGVFRLAPASARDLAALIFDSKLLDGLAPAPTPARKKRK